MELKKIVPRGNTGEDVRTIVLPWKGGRGLDETMAARSWTLELKAVKTLELWLESSTQVAKSPRDITKPVQGRARWYGGDHPGGDACLRAPRATNTHHGLTTETSAQIPWLRKLSHPGMLFGYNQHLDQSMLLIFKLLRYFRAIRFD